MAIFYPKVSAEDWALQHNLKVRERSCVKCGLKQTTTIPYFSQNWLGLIAELHDCGPDYRLSTAIRRDKNERKEWQDFYYTVKSYL